MRSRYDTEQRHEVVAGGGLGCTYRVVVHEAGPGRGRGGASNAAREDGGDSGPSCGAPERGENDGRDVG